MGFHLKGGEGTPMGSTYVYFRVSGGWQWTVFRCVARRWREEPYCKRHLTVGARGDRWQSAFRPDGRECWQPAHPPVGCAFASPSLCVRFPVLNLFSGDNRGGRLRPPRRDSLAYGEHSGIARVCSVVCVGEQSSRSHCK